MTRVKRSFRGEDGFYLFLFFRVEPGKERKNGRGIIPFFPFLERLAGRLPRNIVTSDQPAGIVTVSEEPTENNVIIIRLKLLAA